MSSAPPSGPLAPLIALQERLATAPPQEQLAIIDRIHRDTSHLLLAVLDARNELTACAVLDFVKRLPYDTRQLMNALPDAECANLRAMLEACQRVLTGLIFAEESITNAWQRFTLPVPGFCALIHDLAARLRFAGSNRLLGADSGFNCAALVGRDIAAQSKALGKFCAQADAVAPFDLRQAQQVLDRNLMPLVFSWGMNSYMVSPQWALHPSVSENIRRFQVALAGMLGDPPPGLLVPSHPSFVHALFRAPYVNESIRGFAEQVSRETLAPFAEHCVKKRAPAQNQRKSGGPHRVGIVTLHWNPRHPVHRCLSPMVHHLAAGNFILHWYFLHKGPQEAADLSFTAPPHHARHFPLTMAFSKERFDAMYEAILSDGLDLLFFPEVGMSIEVALLSRLRAARVQAAGYGHPLTTGSAQMDYFLGGAAIEDARTVGEYSERLVLIPGLGVCSTEPPPVSVRQRPLDALPVRLINVSTAHKHNAELMSTWMEILARSEVPIELHIFPSLQNASCRTFEEQLQTLSKSESVTVHAKCSREELMGHLADSDIYLESFPFGGYNTLVEALSTGMPAIARRGRIAPTRFGPAIIDALGLPAWLTSDNCRGYIEAALRLIADSQERLRIRERLGRDAVIQALCGGREPEHFAAAVEWMIREGPTRRDGGRRPAIIEAGKEPRFLQIQASTGIRNERPR